MRLGGLDDVFVGAAWKRLTPHEVDPKVSNGHEFQGINRLRQMLGDADYEFPTTYMLLRDDEPSTLIRSTAFWYDSRRGDKDRSSEWRLYYPAVAGQIQSLMNAGDLMVVAVTPARELVILLAAAGSTREAEVSALFSLHHELGKIQVQLFESATDVDVLKGRLLEALGITLPLPDPVGDGSLVMAVADELIDRYPNALPAGKEVSAMIRKRLGAVDPVTDPDGTLVRWIEAEETAFRLWEDGLIERRLKSGFILPDGRHDVQSFRDFAMKIRQSRIARAGGALQSHVATVLAAHRIQFEEQAVTEHTERPDFLLPDGVSYRDKRFPADHLRMLAVKFTAKDRWRQVLNEAARIPDKHLLTMEAPISTTQIRAMRSARLTPVIPASYIPAFPPAATPYLSSVASFIAEIRELQR